MITCINLNTRRKQFCFEEFPHTPLNYLETDSKKHSVVNFQARDKRTGKVFSVFMKGSELQGLGISLKVWKELASKPMKLARLIENTAEMDRVLKMAAIIASKHLSHQFLKFFTDERTFANRVINLAIYNDSSRLSRMQGVPGMYFHRERSFIDIFINLKNTPSLGSGSYGKIRKVLFLSASEQRSMLVAKKVFRDRTDESSSSHFEREIHSLYSFSNKRGIISLIAGGIYEDKYAIFLPIYECNLHTYITREPFLLTIEEELNMISQWLEGLATLSEKGIHGDISSKNLLLKRKNKKGVEAVISDFGTFRPYGQEEYGLTTIRVGSPEYFAKKMVTSKQDVWGMGICLHEIFSERWLPVWKFREHKEMAEWTATLSPNWMRQCSTDPQTPEFLLDLINVMLDPRHDHRPSAKETFERFLDGRSIYSAGEVV